MKKIEMIKTIAEKSGYSQKTVKEVLDGLKETVLESFTQEPIKILDSITISVIDRPACVRRNPRTGELINVEAKRFPKVKVGRAFKEAANQ